MREVILIKNGEIALKGLNRASFENILIKNVKSALRGLGFISVHRSQSTITVEPVNDGYDMDEACERIGRVFGIAGFSRAAAVEKNMAVILKAAPEYLKQQMLAVKTFKVESKRSDKTFPLNSPQISNECGGAILQAFPHLTVDVHNPDITVYVEIRDNCAYIHAGQYKGAGGMPVGSGGHAAILISGGIDSPVAAYMMAKRGLKLTAVHFASPPYTSERAEQKVKKLLKIVGGYAGEINFAYVPFTELQEQIARRCPEELTTLVMRRYMMKMSQEIAKHNGCEALITGESIGQVASQTLKALAVTDAATDLPVFRPLIGMDKNEIIDIARKIGTLETSQLPYEDCCTVFTPRHPKTRPNLAQVERAEQFDGADELYKKALENVRFEKI